MPVTDANISINLEEVASSAEFEALQRRIASRTPVLPQPRMAEPRAARALTSVGFVRSQQPTQPALFNSQKRGASQIARRSTPQHARSAPRYK